MKYTSLHLWVFGAVMLFIAVPYISFGAEFTYTPFVKIPGVSFSTGDFASYVNQVYKILVAIGATFGVIRIALSGVTYIMSDVVPNKQSALGEIKGVLFGLAILLLPFIVLSTIYPNLTNLNVFATFGNSTGVSTSGSADVDISELETLPANMGRTSCTVGSRVPLSLSDGIIDVVGYALSPNYTDETCQATLDCTAEGDSLTLQGSTYVCTYKKKSVVRSEVCNPKAETAAGVGKTIQQLCTERCAGNGGVIQPDNSCAFTTYVDPWDVND